MKIILFTIKLAKTILCYNSHAVNLCVGCIYNLYVGTTVVLAWYVQNDNRCKVNTLYFKLKYNKLKYVCNIL
jgi:hypothetical protein